MKKFRMDAVRRAAAKRKPGYIEAIFDASIQDGDWLEMPDEDAARIAAEYRLPEQPQPKLSSTPCSNCRGLS